MRTVHIFPAAFAAALLMGTATAAYAAEPFEQGPGWPKDVAEVGQRADAGMKDPVAAKPEIDEPGPADGPQSAPADLKSGGSMAAQPEIEEPGPDEGPDAAAAGRIQSDGSLAAQPEIEEPGPDDGPDSAPADLQDRDAANPQRVRQ